MKKADVEKALSTAPSKEDIATLRQLAGEVERSAISIPRIAVDYRSRIDGQTNNNFGGFCIVKSEKTTDGTYMKSMEVIGKTLECVVLKARYMSKHYDASAEKTTYFTKEFNSFNEPIELFNWEKKSVGFSTYKDHKARYELKSNIILYVWFRENIYRLQLSSSCLGAYWDYEKLFRESHVSLVVTEIGTIEQQKSDSAPVYFLATFGQKGEFPYDRAKFLVGELNEALRIYEKNRDQGREPEQADTSDFSEKEEIVDTTSLPF